MTCLSVEYPALIYKNNKNNLFIANCFVKNIIGMGRTEVEAIKNLENSLSLTNNEFLVKVKPMYELKIGNV